MRQPKKLVDDFVMYGDRYSVCCDTRAYETGRDELVVAKNGRVVKDVEPWLYDAIWDRVNDAAHDVEDGWFAIDGGEVFIDVQDLFYVWCVTNGSRKVDDFEIRFVPGMTLAQAAADIEKLDDRVENLRPVA